MLTDFQNYFTDFLANLPLSLSVKEFWKSVYIWENCGQEFIVLFCDLRCILVTSVMVVGSARTGGSSARQAATWGRHHREDSRPAERRQGGQVLGQDRTAHARTHQGARDAGARCYEIRDVLVEPVRSEAGWHESDWSTARNPTYNWTVEKQKK